MPQIGVVVGIYGQNGKRTFVDLPDDLGVVSEPSDSLGTMGAVGIVEYEKESPAGRRGVERRFFAASGYICEVGGTAPGPVLDGFLEISLHTHPPGIVEHPASEHTAGKEDVQFLVAHRRIGVVEIMVGVVHDQIGLAHILH